MWHRVGVGGGGSMFVPTVSPHDARVVVLGCDMTGSYITHNAGASWRMFNLRGRAHDIRFDPGDLAVIYVATGSAGLWRSRDSGSSWEVIYPKPTSIQTITYRDDHATTEYVLDDGCNSGSITAVAADPSATGRLFAALFHATDARLLVSEDAGETWAVVDAFADTRIIDIRINSSTGSVYVVTERGLHEVTHGVTHVMPTPDGTRLAHALGFVAAESYFYWATPAGVFTSRDYGRNWTESGFGGHGCQLHVLALSEANPEVAYASFDGMRIAGRTCFGVARTIDGGASWSVERAETDGQLDRIDDDWVNETPARSEWSWGIGVGPQDPDLCYTTDWGSAWRTTTGGKSWEQVYFRRVTENSVTTTGLDVTTNYGIFFDPFDSRRQFICYTDIGLLRSEDGGQSWIPTQSGIPRRWHNTAYWMVFDPDVPGRVWVVMSATHDLPRPKMWKSQPTSAYQGGVCRSDDGGRTWQVSSDGLPPVAATHVVLDPRSRPGERTLYLAAMGRGVFMSEDDGRSWKPTNDGIRERDPLASRLSLDDAGGLYLVVFRRRERDGDTGDGGALYRTTIGSGKWHPILLPSGVDGPSGLLVDPEDPNRLYLAAWRRDNDALRAGGGIYRSMDQGRNWECVLDCDQHIYDVTAHPHQPGTLFATGFESNAWVSYDRGTSWKRINGFNFKWGHRVISDPSNPESIYVATFGGGLWHGPVNGSSGREDIVAGRLEYREESQFTRKS